LTLNCPIGFAGILYDPENAEGFSLVVAANSQSVAFANQIAEYGASLARKSKIAKRSFQIFIR
jgi:hypothetical protein